MSNYFFLIEEIPEKETEILFTKLGEENVFFSYFEVKQKYYLFLFSKHKVSIDFVYQSVVIREELNYRRRKIRSIRGFLQYALDVMRTGNLTILETNLSPLFWERVSKIMRQHRNDLLYEFLFLSDQSNLDSSLKIRGLKNKIFKLQQQILELESKP